MKLHQWKRFLSVLLFTLAVACGGNSSNGGSNNGGANNGGSNNGGSNTVDNNGQGGSLYECTNACTKFVDICEYGQYAKQRCIDDCQNAANAAETLQCIEQMQPDESCTFTDCDFVTVHEQFCYTDTPPAEVSQYYDGSWSKVGGGDIFEYPDAESVDDKRLAVGADGSVVLAFSTGPINEDAVKSLIFQYDGSTWNSLAELTATGETEPEVLAAAVDPTGTPYVVWGGGAGQGGTFGDTPNVQVLEWDGSAWQELGTAFEEVISSMLLFDEADAPVVVTDASVSRWDGTQWVV